MMGALAQCIILHDARTKAILWANPAACAVLGFTLEELLPLKAPDMSKQSAAYGRDIGHQWLDGAVANGVNVIEWCYRAKNGEEILSEATATLVRLGQGDAIMVQFRDIGKEEQVRSEMKRLESRLKEFMQDSDEGLAVLGADGAIEYLSAGGRKLLGLAPGAPLPASYTALCDSAGRAELETLLLLALPDDITFPIQYAITLPNGARRWHQASCRYIQIENDLRGHLLHFRDITDQVEAQEMRRRDQASLEYLARYNAMGEMATAIAHELSQPLAAIRNFLEGAMLRLQQDDAPRADIRWGLESAGRQVDHASSIIKSVREYVVKLEQSEVLADLNAIMADIRYFIELRGGEAGVRIAMAPCAERLPVSCEKVLIGQVILNFAFNAIEAMQDFPAAERVVRITSARVDGRAVLSVEDAGSGIDAALHERLFDGFFSSKVSGNGIGLALCQNIVARHRGDIWAEAAPERGAVFCFALPLVQPETMLVGM